MRMPWEERTWVDTFWRNSALDAHLLKLIITRHEKSSLNRKKVLDYSDILGHTTENCKGNDQ